MLNKIIRYYGKENQLRKTIEELSELLVELSRVNTYRYNRSALIEEISDTEIMLNQLKIMQNISNDEIEKIKEFKIERTLRRINEH